MEKLAEYENAEEAGRLFIFPCKVGDTVYQLFATDVVGGKLVYKVFKSRLYKIVIDSYHIGFLFQTLDEKKWKNELTIDAFGKNVFLPRKQQNKQRRIVEEV